MGCAASSNKDTVVVQPGKDASTTTATETTTATAETTTAAATTTNNADDNNNNKEVHFSNDDSLQKQRSGQDLIVRSSTINKASHLLGTYYASSWDSCLGLLKICVKDATDMVVVDKKGKNDPFCVITFGHQSCRTKTIYNNSNPVWDQQAIMSVDETQKSFLAQLSVFDKDVMTPDDIIGMAFFPIEKYLASPNEVFTETHMLYLDETLAKQGDETSKRGILRIEVQFVPKLKVTQLFWQSLANTFDQNGDGAISREELDMMLECLGSTATDDQLDEIIKLADADKDGTLSCDELYKFMSDGKSSSKFLDIMKCPVCNRDLGKLEEKDVVMHLAQCFEAGPNSADRFLVGEFLWGDKSVNGWMKTMMDGGKAKNFQETQGKGYILVQDRKTGLIQREKLAPFVTMPLRVMYQTLIGRFAAEKAKKVLQKLSVASGSKYDDPASAKHISNFVEFYGLNIEEILEPLDSFKTFNEFFYRKLKPDARPIVGVGDETIAVSPADCRCMVFDNVDDATRLWIKGKNFTLEALLGNNKELSALFQGGSLMIARLAPQDYHRYHFPVSGKILQMTDIPGCLFTVSPLAVNENVDVYTENKRMVTLIETTEFGTVAVVTIGATMVGSIRMTAKVGDVVQKGDEHGYFAFGGSTELVLFQPNIIKFDNDLLGNSIEPLETLIQMGSSVGKARKE